MAGIEAQFTQIVQLGMPTWIRKDRQAWVRKYDAIPGVRTDFYQAYRALHPVAANRAPGSVDNERVGERRATLQEALADALPAGVLATDFNDSIIEADKRLQAARKVVA